MARHQEPGQPANEEAFDRMPDRISDHFDHVRELLETAWDSDHD